MKILGLSQQDLIVQSLESEMNRLNIRKQCQVLTNANAALTEQRDKLLEARNDLRSERQSLSEQLQTTADKLSVVEGDRDTMQAERDAYQKGRDCFKSKYKGCQSELVVVKAKLLAYQTQRFWDRVFRRMPY